MMVLERENFRQTRKISSELVKAGMYRHVNDCGTCLVFFLAECQKMALEWMCREGLGEVVEDMYRREVMKGIPDRFPESFRIFSARVNAERKADEGEVPLEKYGTIMQRRTFRCALLVQYLYTIWKL